MGNKGWNEFELLDLYSNSRGSVPTRLLLVGKYVILTNRLIRMKNERTIQNSTSIKSGLKTINPVKFNTIIFFFF